MSCDVCIGVDSLDVEFDKTYVLHPTARREHTCCECNETIRRGDRYELVIGHFEGNAKRYRTCVSCEAIRMAFVCGRSWYFESLWPELEEFAFGQLTTASECFQALSASDKERVLNRWRIWKGLKGDCK